jgi:hypothetical protein
MPRIDPLLTAMVSNRADAVRLADGDIAHIIKGGAKHPLTRQPLGDGQLLLLLREMAPPDVIPTLGAADVEFIYANGEGRFVTRVSRENGTLQAMVVTWLLPPRRLLHIRPHRDPSIQLKLTLKEKSTRLRRMKSRSC